jgi:hypothetical protein
MKDTLVKRFVIGTFVSLYALVSVISTIHVIDFFELSNPYWLAVTLAIGFEIGAAASLASLVILKKMNKTLVWALFITITLMQMQGNMYYAFINMADFNSWAELFALIEEEPIFQKRVLAAISGAILPLIALGFIKSLVDYIKPDEETEELTSGSMDDSLFMNDFETKPSEEYFEDIEEPIEITKDEAARSYDAAFDYDEAELQEMKDWEDATLEDLIKFEDGSDEEEWDEDHALDQVMNDMVSDFTEEDVKAIIDAVENPNDPIETLVDAAEQYKETLPEKEEINPTSVGSIVQKIETPHLPQDEPKVKTEEQIWNEAMDKKAKEEMEAFIKNKNAGK